MVVAELAHVRALLQRKQLDLQGKEDRKCIACVTMYAQKLANEF